MLYSIRNAKTDTKLSSLSRGEAERKLLEMGLDPSGRVSLLDYADEQGSSTITFLERDGDDASVTVWAVRAFGLKPGRSMTPGTKRELEAIASEELAEVFEYADNLIEAGDSLLGRLLTVLEAECGSGGLLSEEHAKEMRELGGAFGLTAITRSARSLRDDLRQAYQAAIYASEKSVGKDQGE